MKIGRGRYVQEPENQAHKAEKPLESGWDHEKSDKDNGYLTGFLEKPSIMRISLTTLRMQTVMLSGREGVTLL